MAWVTGEYCSLEDVKAELGIVAANTNDDAKLQSYITAASREIDTFTKRRFYGVVDTRYYHALNDTDGRRLLLDYDLSGVIEITLGDGSVLAASDYVLEPYNEDPKFAVVLKASSDLSWKNYDTDPERAIAVEGTWGYTAGTVPPEAIRRAAISYTRWRYLARRASPTSGQTGTGGIGEYPVTSHLPDEVQRMLTPFRSFVIKAVGGDV